MIYKNIFNFFILLSSVLTFSQNNNSEATYRFYIQQEENKEATSGMRREQKEVDLAAKKVLLKLIFNDSLSMYYVEHGLMKPQDDLNYSLALTYCEGETPIYTNKNNKTIIYSSLPEFMYKKGEFLVTDSIPKWKLSNESKMINNYTCYKATYEKEYPYYSEKVLKTITAWYCPEFPYPYGPKGYCGLPGLIFEVQDNKTVIGIESISLKSNNAVINIPNQGKVLTNIEYQLKMNNSINEYREYLKNKKDN